MELIAAMILLIGCVICVCVVASKGIHISVTVKQDIPDVEVTPITPEMQKQLEEQQKANQEIAANVQKILGVFQDE